jgi:hypothetical protein
MEKDIGKTKPHTRTPEGRCLSLQTHTALNLRFLWESHHPALQGKVV